MRFSKKYWPRKHGSRIFALLLAVGVGAVQGAPAAIAQKPVAPATNAAQGAPAAIAQKPAAPATNAVPAVVVIPKSVFHDDIASGGRDPFYPQSARRMQSSQTAKDGKVEQPATIKANTLLFLRGIVSGTENRKLALINNRHFAMGETNEVTVEGGKLLVQCLEIKENAVVVRIVGKSERYDLHMRLE